MRKSIYTNGFFKVTSYDTNYHVVFDNVDEDQIVDYDETKRYFLRAEKGHESKVGFVAAFTDEKKAIDYADRRKNFYLSSWEDIEARN